MHEDETLEYLSHLVNRSFLVFFVKGKNRRWPDDQILCIFWSCCMLYFYFLYWKYDSWYITLECKKDVEHVLEMQDGYRSVDLECLLTHLFYACFRWRQWMRDSSRSNRHIDGDINIWTDIFFVHINIGNHGNHTIIDALDCSMHL